MGTRGYYVFKRRGRYYVYYNHWDSYPQGLGKQLTASIPSEPEAYQKWLEQKRQEYSQHESRLEQYIFAVSPARALIGAPLPLAAAGIEWMETLPWYAQPDNDLFIEWIYTFDLDHERLSVNNSSHFHLHNLPENWDDLLDEAEQYFKGKLSDDEVHESITTKLVQDTEPSEDPTAAYKQLEAIVVSAKRHSTLNAKPAFILCKAIFSALLANYDDHIRIARFELEEGDILFQETAYALLCLASCSPDLVRLATEDCIGYGEETNFAFMRLPEAGGTHTAFTSAIFQGFHLKGTNAGGAPRSSSYWLDEVLVYLDAQLHGPINFQRAVVTAVSKGRSEGRSRFNVIVTSIKRVILIRVTEDSVQHTDALPFVESEASFSSKSSRNNMLATDYVSPAFEAIAHLFEAEKLSKLRPSSAYTHGRFPNEIYRMIVENVDPATRDACRSVSRALRDYSTNSIPVVDGLALRCVPDLDGLQCFHAKQGHLGPFQLSRTIGGHQAGEGSVRWYPTIASSTGTAACMPLISITLDCDMEEPYGDPSAASISRASEESYYLDPTALEMTYRKFPREERKPSVDPDNIVFNYELFERHLSHQIIIAASRHIAQLYYMVFFLRLGIFLPDTSYSLPFERRAVPEITKMPMNTFVHVATRVGTGRYGPKCCVLLVKQLCEDTAASWKQATEEAKRQASEELLEALYEVWIACGDEKEREMAILVIIGSKFKVLHRSDILKIPSLKDFPSISEKVNAMDKKDRWRLRNNRDLWQQAGISEKELQSQMNWDEIKEMRNENTPRHQVLDVLNPTDRPQIEQAFSWLATAMKAGGNAKAIFEFFDEF